MKKLILCHILQIHEWEGYTRPYIRFPGQREYRLGRRCKICDKDVDLGDM